MKARRHRQIRGFLILIAVCILVYFAFDFGTQSVKLWLYPLKYEAAIERFSNEFDLDPMFVAAVINVESRFQTDAESHKGAKGLMQVCDSTAIWASEELGIENFEIGDLFDPETNIQIGCWYLNRLRIEFGDKEKLILAAYNGGSGNVNKWLENKDYSHDGENLNTIPFEETSQYVEKVLEQYPIYLEMYSLYEHEVVDN